MPWFEKIRARARSFASTPRYHGATGDDPDEAELLAIPSQHSIASALQVATKDTKTIDDPTLAVPLTEEANSSDRNSSQNPKPRWISGVYLCAKATAGLLLLNVIFISVAGGLARSNSGEISTSKVIYNGSCTVTGRWNTALHVIINVLSTCILAASNYCMQTLVAPTRHEIDVLHAKRRWLDIGGASLRNLFMIPFNRLGLWLILMITATPFHLLYNSVVFESLSYNDYWSFVGPSDIDAQNVRSLTTPALETCFGKNVFSGGLEETGDGESIDWNQIVNLVSEEKSEAISLQQCYNYRDSRFLSGYKGIIVLGSNLTMKDGGNTSVRYISGRLDAESVITLPFVNPNISTTSPECPLDTESDFSTLYQTLPVSGCLAFEGEENCRLLFNTAIGVIIPLATLAKAITMFLAAYIQQSRAPPLLTTGDAIASFLGKPDSTTQGMCWASMQRIKKGNWTVLSGGQLPSKEVYKHLSPRRQWRKASSPFCWFATSFIFSLGIGLGLGVSGGSVLDFTFDDAQGLWNSEKSGKNAGYYISNNSSEMKGVVTANSVQMVVTLGYYFFNSVLTSMLASAEYSSYGADRKALRVTWPIKDSEQRSTYWLSVPYKYGVPILLLFTAIHWCVSQGFRYVLMIPYGSDDKPLFQKKVSSIGVSTLPLFIASMIGLALGISLLCLAFRRLKSTIPLAGSCSAAISAACHPPEDVCTATAAHGKLVWGETGCVNDGDEPRRGHCSFTPLEARQPSLGKLYA